MEDNEFPIPTSHIIVELLSQIGKTDLIIKSEKLLISVDISLLDRKALQLYKIYPFPAFQNISENHTRAVYIIPKNGYFQLKNQSQSTSPVKREKQKKDILQIQEY